MKTIFKQLVAVVALMTFAFSAQAAELNKGSKSFQKTAQKPAETMAMAPEKAEDMANIAPAAGAVDEPMEAGKKEKNMRDEIRLPRKN